MKLLIVACFYGLLGLTGCASTGIATPEQPTAIAVLAAPDLAVSKASDTAQPEPVIPGGALRPITQEQAASLGVAQLAPPADLWERIRRGYAMPNLESALVHDRELWYSSRSDYILRMTERSRKYMFHIVEELERRNMPTELALLPFVESAFNPQAVSSAKAAGIRSFDRAKPAIVSIVNVANLKTCTFPG